MENTKKKKAATPLSTTIYASAFNQALDLVYLLDDQCVLIDCNQNLLASLGLHAIPNKTVGSIYKMLLEHGSWTEEQVQRIKKHDIDALVSQTDQLDDELPIFDQEQQIRYIHLSRMPLRDPSGQIVGLMVVLRDVSEQKKLNEQLQAMKKELQQQNAHQNVKVGVGSQGTPQNKTPNILLIEDNYVAQQAAKSVLMACDCLVDTAANELEFNELFEPGKYDVILMDIGLENTSGYAFAKQLRKIEEGTGHKVPIIALTSFDPVLVSLDCDYYQMEGAIGKPLKPEQVKQILQHYVHHIDIEITGMRLGISPV